MQSFTVFDIIIISFTILLGLKGLLRGFIKEFFALVGLVGGIFVASRIATDIGSRVAPILGLNNQTTINLIGFIVGIILFWAIAYLLGRVISKIFSVSGLGFFDRIFGFIFGSAKIFLFFSIIIFCLYQISAFKNLMNDKLANTLTFPLLIKTGDFIIKLDPSVFVKKVENTILQEKEINKENPDLINKKNLTKEIEETINEIKEKTLDSGAIITDVIKNSLNENADKIQETANKTQDETIKTQEAIKQEVKNEIEKIEEGN